PSPGGSITTSEIFLLIVVFPLIAISKLRSTTDRKFRTSKSLLTLLQFDAIRISHLSRRGRVGRLSIMPPSTYTCPLRIIGLNTTGTQQDASTAGMSSPESKYSTVPLLRFVAVTVTGVFKQLKLFSGIIFNRMSLSLSR